MRMIVVSDVHLGVRRVSAQSIIKGLDAAFSDENLLTTDLVVWAGDTFDMLLSLNHDELPIIDLFIAKFLRRCKRHNVTVYILHGTKSHDRDQPERFVTINEIAEIHADLHYFNKLSIWYEERFDMNFLFVPDEWHHDTNETLRQVHELLEAKRLKQVDFSIMHGNFKHHLPEVARAPKHDEQSYLQITKHIVFIGHNHTNREYDRIRTPGSFARISHGEEEPKGYYTCDVLSNGTCTTTFVENKFAQQFRTVNCLGLSDQETLDAIYRVADTLGEGDFIRIIVDAESPYRRNIDSFIVKYPLIRWSVESQTVKKSEMINALKRDVDYTPIYITPDNIAQLLQERLGQIDQPAAIKERMLEQLSNLIEHVTPS